MKTEIGAAEFKANCLSILDDVAKLGREVVITKRGKPVARLLPIEPPKPLEGSVTIVNPDDDLFSAFGDEEWDGDWSNIKS